MTTQIKITQLVDIGANLTTTTVLPVVNMTGVPTTQKTNLGNVGNIILEGAGTLFKNAALANLAYSVTNAAQPNITSVGTLNINTLMISGGSSGQVLSTDGDGTVYWATGSSGGTPGGPSGAVQINWQGDFSNQGGTPGDTYSTLQFDSNGMPTLDGTNAYQQRVDNSPYMQILTPRVESTDFGIVAGPGLTVVGYDDTYNTPRSAYVTLQDQANATQQWDFGILGNGDNNFVVSDRTNSNQWTFGTSGNLTLPGNTSSINYANGSPYGGGGNANTGNIGFDNTIIYSLSGATLDNSDLAHDATGQFVVPANGGGNVEVNNTYGNVLVQTGVDGTSFTGQWKFDNEGNLTLPDIANPSINYANGDPYSSAPVNTGNVTFDNINVIGTGNLNLQPDPADTGAYLDIFLTSGPDIHIVASQSANLILGKDDQSNVMTSWDGGVYVQSWDNGTNTQGGVWSFGGDGSTIFPTSTVQRGDNPSGTITGQTLLFGDNTQEAIISTPDGNSSYVNSQRLVINPGQGYDYGEGGDIYLWAGRGGPTNGSGGDIKIRGGQGMADGTGGYIRIEGGDTQGAAYPGYIDITGGIGGNTQGAYVRITGGQGATNGGEAGVYGGYGTDVGGDANIAGGFGGTNQGGNINITGGGSALGLAGYGNVNINAGASAWYFDNIGVISAGGNLKLAPSSASPSSYLDIFLTSGPDLHLVASNGANLILGKDDGANVMTSWNGNAYIQSWDLNTGNVGGIWAFDGDGNLTLPANATIKNNAEVSYGGGVNIQVSDLANAVVASPGSLVGNTYNNTGFTKIIFTDSTLYNALVTAGIEPETIVATTWSNGSTTQLNTYVYVQFPGSPDTFSLRPCDANGNTVVGDWVFPSVVGTTVPANIAITSVGSSASPTWNFISDGNLTVPGAIVGAGYSRLDMVTDGPNTAYLGTTNNDTTALYLQKDTVQLYANTDVYITANTGGTSQGWTFGADGNLTLPTTVLDVGLTENTKIRSQRKIIPPYGYSAIINSAFPDPTVVYTATNAQTTSMKVAVQVQHSGLGFEMFDVSATYTGSDTYYSVSNRLKPPTITDTTVLVNLNGSGVMQITLTINSGAKPAWITYDATEFGIPND